MPEVDLKNKEVNTDTGIVEVDTESLDEGEWFYYQNSHLARDTNEWVFEEPSKHARVRIRRIQPFLQERMFVRKKETEHVLNRKTRAMERISYFKELTAEEMQKENDDTWDYAITGIENFKDKKTGKNFECTRESKLKLIKVPAFDRFIGKCLRILEGEEAAAGKN